LCIYIHKFSLINKEVSMKKITILGSTGSIGTQTLEIVKEFPIILKFKAYHVIKT